MKDFGFVILFIVIIGFLITGFYIKRYINYSFFYRDKTKELIKEQTLPLQKRIEILEKRQNTLLRLLNHD